MYSGHSPSLSSSGGAELNKVMPYLNRTGVFVCSVRVVIQHNLYVKDTLRPAIFVLYREVSSSRRLKIQ